MVTKRDQPVYISTIPHLAFELQLQVFRNIRVWAALNFDAKENANTSNPFLLVKQYCRIVGGVGTSEDITKWKEVRLTLGAALQQAYITINNENEFSEKILNYGLQRINEAQLSDASPIVLVINHDPQLDIDWNPPGVNQGVELIIKNLKPDGKYKAVRISCDQEIFEQLSRWVKPTELSNRIS
jgi:hypothetical protein